ncbi:MAG TPA: single-stranded-DNA-specific exonuclease RecJ [Coriobacteriia bacterium]|nr:single-stranded-DNA-specific exonuclease RecJ [Coriobacteriia bacterium]
MTRGDETVRGCGARVWDAVEVDDDAARRLARETGLSLVLARILLGRGVTTRAAVERFLDPDLDREWHDPDVIPGMRAAAERVARAVSARERVVVFGDFDLDGVSAAALTERGLRALGADVTAIVSHRFDEGYGLTPASLARLRASGAELVVTVDCGISAAAEVRQLREWGVDVVVTDHHEPGEAVPEGVPVANPKLDPACPSRDLAGAGVALKLVHAVARELGEPDAWREFTGIAALGTVADVVPLVGENRALVADGLERMRRSPGAGVASLAAVSSVSLSTLTTETVAYKLAPRLNAAGRMADPSIALELLTTADPVRADLLARELDALNRERQRVECDLERAAMALAEREYAAGDRVLVLSSRGWHEGVKGIVASRLARRFGVPTFLFSVEGDEARGSGRTAGRVDLYRAVSSAGEMLTRFGGHEGAVGLTIEAGRVDEFRRRMLGHLDLLPAEEFVTAQRIDATIELGHVGLDLAAELATLEPFGSGNPRPLFSTEGVFMSGRERVGADSSHLRFDAYNGADSVPAIAFRCPDIRGLALCDAPVDLAFEVRADEWRGRARVQMRVLDIAVREPDGYSPVAELVDDLFARADEILAREDYGTIEDAESFHTKLAGVTFEGRQEVVARLTSGTPLRVVREPENPHDPSAIALHDAHGSRVGYFNRRLSGVLAAVLDAGVEYDVEVSDVTGGDGGRALGVNVLVSRRADADGTAGHDGKAARRETLASLAPAALDEALVRAFIGEGVLHEAQRRALNALDEGGRCLVVMATGRGKSLIFHVHAARVAVRDRHASVFVFPLRALVADQAFHLEEAMTRAGVAVRTLTGESSPGARDETFSGLRDGSVDVVLTTPEFLTFHAERFAATGRVRFLVVDEAHHVGRARASHRPAYLRLGEAAAALGGPAVLAVTATAGDATAEAIVAALGITSVVTDPTIRDNLVIEDRRGIADKDTYLAALATRGEKMIVYVNSRDQAVRLARMLRKRVPAVATRVAFYNGGLSRSVRHAVERAFRDGDVSVVVATSAFGEGVNIPDVRHVVLYHLPFNDIEFNQMCGRCGRDGALARVHLLFGRRDGRVNEMILGSAAPSRDDLAALYRVLRELGEADAGGFEATNAEIAERVCALRKGSGLNDRGVSSGIGIFRELGLVEGEGHGAFRRLWVTPAADRVDLASSVRYAEGLEEISEFEAFRSWVLSADADELLARFNRPILPSLA